MAHSLLKGFHKHHIIPKHVGGTDEPNNLVLLHPIDHAIFHLLRFRQTNHPGDAWAFNRIMSNECEDKFLSGYKRSDETKRKLSESRKGKPLSESHRASLTGIKRKPKTLKKTLCVINGVFFNYYREAAKHFNVHETTIRRWLQEKHKPQKSKGFLNKNYVPN